QKQSGNKNVQYMACDMRDGAAITALVKNVAEKEGSIDVLVNNAGGPPAGGFREMEGTDWQAAFEQKLLSVVRASRAATAYMREHTKSGVIVNITSSSIKQSIENSILYNTMRPGVLGLTKSMPQESAAA